MHGITHLRKVAIERERIGDSLLFAYDIGSRKEGVGVQKHFHLRVPIQCVIKLTS